jgi:segregation and condensation protein B
MASTGAYRRVSDELRTNTGEATMGGAGRGKKGHQLATVLAAPWLRNWRWRRRPAVSHSGNAGHRGVKQPLTRPEIEAIRGVDVAGVVKTLMDRRLVKIVGRKDVPGRPMMFGTTKEFLQAFGLKDLSDLPTLRDFAEIARATDASVETPPKETLADAPEAGEPIAAAVDGSNAPAPEALEQPAS